MGERCPVLIIDFDETTLIALQSVLEDAGFDTTTTWNVGEAVQLSRSQHFDLVLLGHHPPELNAEKALDELRTQNPLLPCLVLLSSAQDPDVERLRSSGALAVIPRWDHFNTLNQLRKCQGRGCWRPQSMSEAMAG